MPNWLARATGGGRSSESDDAKQAFQLTCECNARHVGQRKGRPQRIICQTCGAALFVLPKNIYPPPKAKAGGTAKKPRRKRHPGGPPTGPGLPSTSEMASSVREGIVGAAENIGDRLTKLWLNLIQGTRSAAAGAAQSIRSFFTPFRLILSGIAIMLIATAVVAIQSRAREAARETFRIQLAAGQEALTADDLPTARDHFAAAAAAVETLGSTDAQAQLVRQLHRETTAMTRLAPGTLFDLVEEAEKSHSQIGGVSWKHRFAARYEGTWLVLQAPVRAEDSSFVLAVPMAVGSDGRDVVVHANLEIFRDLTSPAGVADAIFAAPLQGCVLDEDRNAWVVTLDASGGFLWSDAENLRSLGFFDAPWVDEEEVASLLSAQTEIQQGIFQ